MPCAVLIKIMSKKMHFGAFLKSPNGKTWAIFLAGVLGANSTYLSGQDKVEHAPAEGGDWTDIVIGPAPQHEVRFTFGLHIYVEALVEGRWLNRYWSCDGHFGYGGFGEPAFELQIKEEPRQEAGSAVAGGWQWISAAEAPRTERGARHHVVELANPSANLTVRVHTLLDPTPILTRWLEITNTSDRPRALTAAYPWAGGVWPRLHKTTVSEWQAIQGSPFTLGYQPLEPGMVKMAQQPEGLARFEWKPLPAGKTVVESVKGGAYDDPFFIVRNEAEGEYFIGHLAWSGNWRMEFEHDQDSPGGGVSLSFKIGPAAKDALRVLAPGQTISTPAVHLGRVAGDLDVAVQAMHEHLRRSVLLSPAGQQRAYLVQYDSGPPEEKTILKHIDIAAALGAEAIILCHGWWIGYGEWTPSPERFPNGLKPVVDYAHEKRLLFGLYGELESGRGDWSRSRVFKEHPDWFLGPQKTILDLTKPEVAAYLETELARLIEQSKLDIYAHEYVGLYLGEGPSTSRDGFMENNFWRYYDALYRIFDNLHARYPNVILQQSAAGGARQDVGLMSRVHESYTGEGGIRVNLRT
ncbi:MAG: alpha-galactosidase [Planctomycetes bacterium]|nr:alpha-galactosidase [Planctomycetota bacterium]